MHFPGIICNIVLHSIRIFWSVLINKISLISEWNYGLYSWTTIIVFFWKMFFLRLHLLRRTNNLQSRSGIWSVKQYYTTIIWYKVQLPSITWPCIVLVKTHTENYLQLIWKINILPLPGIFHYHCISYALMKN